MVSSVLGRIRPIVLILVVGLVLAVRSGTIARAQSGSIPAPPTDVRLVAEDASTGDPAIVDSLRRHGISDLQLAREPMTVPTPWERPGTLQYGGVLAFNAARN